MTLGRQYSLPIVFAACLASLAIGALTAYSTSLAVAAVGSVIALVLAFTLPETLLLAVFAFLSLSGIRPFPPVFGFHIQVQYFLLLPMLVRSLLTPLQGEAWFRDRWRPIIWLSVILVATSIIAFLQDVGQANLTTAFGNYVAWLMAFVFLTVIVRLAWSQGPAFSRSLYTILLDVLGFFAVYTLFTGVGSLHSLGAISTIRLSIGDLGPNATGLAAAAGTMMAIAPVTIRGFRLRQAIWIPFLLALLVLTGSRESLGALAFALIVLMFYRRSGRSLAWYLYVLAGIVAMGIFIVNANGSVVPHSLLRSINFPELTPYLTIFGIHLPTSLAERVYIQVSGFQVFLHHPILGIGFHQPLQIPEGGNSATWWGPPSFIPVAQDSYITIAAQQGIIGVAAFAGLVIFALKMAGAAARDCFERGEDYDIAAGIRTAIIVLVLGSLNIDALYADFRMTVLLFWLAVCALLLQKRVSQPNRLVVSKTASPGVTGPSKPPAPLPAATIRSLNAK